MGVGPRGPHAFRRAIAPKRFFSLAAIGVDVSAIASRHVSRAPSVVFRHIKCAHWGLATLQWEQEDKRCFRFEDGTERIFSSSFLHLLEPVDAPIRMELCAPLPREIPIAFDDQVTLFEQWFPGGFAGELWQADRRGTAPGRRLKR